MTMLVLGATGQLGTHLRGLLPNARCWGRNELDLAEPTRVAAAIEAVRPSFIVNAAGYTAVDQAESEPELAWRINAESAAAIARAALALDIPLVHVSTDYVFDGRKADEYAENDATHALNVYGASKLAGELATRVLCKKSWILRTSWVFSEHGSNFVKTILRLAATNSELSIVRDQRGRPTYAGDLAAIIAAIVREPERVPPGTYHAVGGPIVSWHAFAELIVQEAHALGVLENQPVVRAIATSEHPRAAQRPANSALRPSIELQRTLGLAIDWRKGLRAVLSALRPSG